MTLPGVLHQQRFDEVHGQRWDALERLLRVVHADLGDVEKGLLLVVSQKWRLARQHEVDENPDAPGRWFIREIKQKVEVVCLAVNNETQLPLYIKYLSHPRSRLQTEIAWTLLIFEDQSLMSSLKNAQGLQLKS